MDIIAHRGGAGVRVENTLAAFGNAAASGVWGAELDVHLTRDSEVVVHHDDHLNPGYCRRDDGTWIGRREKLAIADLTLAELQRFDIGSVRPGTAYDREFPEIVSTGVERVPLLHDVIGCVSAISPDFHLLIEIKSGLLNVDHAYLERLVDTTIEVVKASGFADRAVFCSFDWGCMIHAKKQCAEISTWLLSPALSWLGEGTVPEADIPPRASTLKAIRALHADPQCPWFAGFDPRRFGGSYPQAVAAAGADAWYPYYRDCSAAVSDEAHRLGQVATAWTNNVRDRRAVLDLAAMGVDMAAVDYPDLLADEGHPAAADAS